MTSRDEHGRADGSGRGTAKADPSPVTTLVAGQGLQSGRGQRCGAAEHLAKQTRPGLRARVAFGLLSLPTRTKKDGPSNALPPTDKPEGLGGGIERARGFGS